jgi:hypothetical protein
MTDNDSLTRPKGSKLPPKEDPIIESDTEKYLPEPELPRKSKTTKPRPAKTQAQLDAFKIALAKRQENIKIKKEEKKIDAAKLLLEHDRKTQEAMPHAEEKPDRSIKKARSKKIIVEESESESEPEVIYIKKKSKTKKPKQKQIIIESESETETELDTENELIIAKQKKSFGKSHKNQLNKRPPVIEVQPTKPPPTPSVKVQSKPNYSIYFAD